jgi:excinuclease ABC subunit C
MIAALPARPGVYRFRNAAGRVLYVGRAAELRGRVSSYWSDLGDRRHLQPMVAQIERIDAVVCASRHEAAWLERNLLESSLPRWNRTRGGQEVPVQLRLQTGAATPELSVVHLGDLPGVGELFGPYLGGLQVRRAVTGLHRVHPVAWTGSRLSATERSLAANRGLGERDRTALVETVRAVLRGDETAVQQTRYELEQVRDRAAAAEAFELAGRVQAELQGLDWITSPQRVTLLDHEDSEVSGWSAGVLVRFDVRDGRLDRWTQRPSSLAAAQPRLARTPDRWVEFAQQNAELAAALR